MAGLTGGLLVGVLLDPNMVVYIGAGGGATNLPGFSSAIHGHWTLLRWQAETAGWVIGYTAIATFIILKVIGIFLPLRLSDEELEIGDRRGSCAHRVRRDFLRCHAASRPCFVGRAFVRRARGGLGGEAKPRMSAYPDLRAGVVEPAIGSTHVRPPNATDSTGQVEIQTTWIIMNRPSSRAVK